MLSLHHTIFTEDSILEGFAVSGRTWDAEDVGILDETKLNGKKTKEKSGAPEDVGLPFQFATPEQMDSSSSLVFRVSA